MKLKEFDILLDIKKPARQAYFEVVQGDHETNVLNITLMDGLGPYDITGTDIEIAFAKTDGTTVLQDIENGISVVDAESGKIECILKTNTIAAYGRVAAEVRVIEPDTDKLLTSARFDFFVRRAIFGDDTIKSTNEWPLYEQLINAAENEAERNDAEIVRAENEDTRIASEVIRQDNETIRQTNEQSRNDAEGIRQSNETARQASISDIENRWNELTTAQQQEAEVINARTSTVKGKTFSQLTDRIEEIEEDTIDGQAAAQEIIDARKGKPTLRAKMDDLDSQLAEKASKEQMNTIDYIEFGELTLPSDFEPSLPFKLYRDFDGRIKHTWDLTNEFETGAELTLYCNNNTGSDANDGTVATPYATIKKCLQVAEASSYTKIQIRVQTHMMRDCVHDSSTQLVAMPITNKIITIIPDGNERLAITNGQTTQFNKFNKMVWSADGTAWKGTRSATWNVFDLKNRDVFGVAKPLKWVNSVLECQTTPNSWYTDDISVWVNTFDSRQPDGEIVVCLNSNNVWFKLTNAKVYFRNFEFYSGYSVSMGSVHIDGDLNSLAVFNDCKFAGGEGKDINFGSTPKINALTTWGVGQVYCFNCVGAYSARDCFNYHIPSANWVKETARRHLAFEYECIGYEAGIFTSIANGGTSNNNATTAHNSISILRIGSIGYNTMGPVLADANACYTLAYDCKMRDSVKDITSNECASYYFDNSSAFDGLLGVAKLVNCQGGGRRKWDIVGWSGQDVRIRNFRGYKFDPAPNITFLE